MPITKELTKDELFTVLNSVPSLSKDVQLLTTSLKRRQLSGSQQCAKATLEMIRSMIAKFNFTSTDQMMRTVRALGKELCQAAPSEFSIGNLVRRVLYFIREEHVNAARDANGRSGSRDFSAKEGKLGSKPRRDRGNSVGSNPRDDEEGSRRDRENSFSANGPSRPHAPSFAQHPSLEHLLNNAGALSLDDHSRCFPGLKSAVLSAIHELSTEIDNHVAICQRAPDYIHSDECILTYGHSKLVESFLKAAAGKRRFQLIIAEAAPSLEGHKLAEVLAKVPNIALTLVPDSNIYALMSRVNKVVLCPQAIMADGGAISSSGHYMVALAARDFSVPVVCVSPAFSLTPLFAHNQTHALQQLLSPSSVLPYHADVDFANVEVSNPAFDHLPPDLISLYVTNDGSQLPSYVFRQLTEYYHPQDYAL